MTTALNPPTFPVEIVDIGSYNEIPIDEILKHLFLEGIIENVTDPERFTATMDAYSLLAALTVPVLKGSPGVPGDNAISPQFENYVISDLNQIPTDLGDTNADLGRFYVYTDTKSTTIYVWTGALPQNGGTLGNIPGMGQGWVQLPVGKQGAPGPYANLNPWLALTAPENGQGPYGADSWVSTNDNGIQTVAITGSATAGNLALTLIVNGVSRTTSNIAYNAISAASIQSALAALSTVGSGNVHVYDTNGASPYTVVFAGSIDVQGISVMAVASSPTGATVTVAGGTAATPNQAWYLAVPPGEDGPSSPLGGFVDVDFQTTPPQQGDVVVCSTRVTPAAPAGLAAVGSTTGGTLAAATYYYKVTACVPNGETVGSNEVSVTTTGSTSKVTLTWSLPSGGGATGYRVYRGTAAGAENVLVGVIVSGTTLSFVDTGAPTLAGTPPTTGITANKPIWVNEPQLSDEVKLYTMPRAAFTSGFHITFGSGLTTVGTFSMPPQPFAWVPVVFSEVTVEGISLSLTPLLAQAQVALGSPNGQIVARGSGNSIGTITMGPDLGNIAATPLNGIGVVPANHSGNEGTLYVSLINQGLIDIFEFNAGNNAKLSVLVVPVYNVLSLGVYATTNVNVQMAVPGISTGVGNVKFNSPLVRMGTPTVTIS